MLQDNLLLILSLLFAVSMLSMVSNKLGISYPIFLVIAGVSIGFIPAIPDITLKPDIIFLIFLPPLLYAGAWNTSWKTFWELRRPIGLLSIGLVIFTSTAVAFISTWLIPGFPLAYGFLLGAIISPPDAVAATSVLQGLNVPKKISAILEGESLVNDASSLIVFRFAIAAILTGQFNLFEASTQFLLVAGMGLAIGVAIAFLIYILHRFLPTTPSIDTGLTLISPYIMYILAEHFHFSGVMAVVSGGLFLSFRSHEIFAYDSRIQAYSFWEAITFLLNGVVFILLGLQLPIVLKNLGEQSLGLTIAIGLFISVITILIRIIWVVPGAYIPRWLSARIRKREPDPGIKNVFLVAWSGMRGVVSLAAALAVPLTLPGGQPFPHRNLILLISFIVIMVTLVIQGLSLPWVIRKLKISSDDAAEKEQEMEIKLALAMAALDHLKTNYANEVKTIDAFQRMYDRYQRMADISAKKLLSDDPEQETPDFLPAYRKMLLELVDIRRERLLTLKNERKMPDELLRNKEWELDLEEARLNE